MNIHRNMAAFNKPLIKEPQLIRGDLTLTDLKEGISIHHIRYMKTEL